VSAWGPVLACLAYPALVYLGVRLLLGVSYRRYRRERRAETRARYEEMVARARLCPERDWRAEGERIRADLLRQVTGTGERR